MLPLRQGDGAPLLQVSVKKALEQLQQNPRKSQRPLTVEAEAQHPLNLIDSSNETRRFTTGLGPLGFARLCLPPPAWHAGDQESEMPLTQDAFGRLAQTGG